MKNVGQRNWEWQEKSFHQHDPEEHLEMVLNFFLTTSSQKIELKSQWHIFMVV